MHALNQTAFEDKRFAEASLSEIIRAEKLGNEICKIDDNRNRTERQIAAAQTLHKHRKHRLR